MMQERFLSSEEYDEEAYKLYDEGDYEGALEMLKEGLSLYPNAVELYVGMGYARLAREEYAWARESFQHALIPGSRSRGCPGGNGRAAPPVRKEGECAQALRKGGRLSATTRTWISC